MVWCEYCDKEINKSYISRHINSFGHKANLRKSSIKPQIIVSPLQNYNKEVDPLLKSMTWMCTQISVHMLRLNIINYLLGMNLLNRKKNRNMSVH